MKIASRWSRHFSNLPVRHKLNLLTLLIALGVIALAVLAARIQYLDLYQTRMNELKLQVELANSVMAHQAALVDAGQTTLEQAQSVAIETLAGMRTESDSGAGSVYFTLFSLDGKVVMHPFRRDRAGREVAGFDDGHGLRMYEEQVEAARAGGGYVLYKSSRPDHEGDVPRLSYAATFEPWGWVNTTGAYTGDVQQQALRFTAIMTMAGGTVVLLVFALSWAIGNRITVPLRRATAVADAIAHGKLDNAIGNQPSDEPGRLLESMHRMQDQLHAVISAQREMARQHDAGLISYRMDADAFPGEYGQMVGGTNELVQAHIAIKVQIMSLVQRYAVGDLSQDMPALPAEQAAITQTMATVKHNLAGINTQIQQLAKAAAAGDFSLRGDTSRFDHEFRSMIENLNAMMQVSDGNLAQISQLLRAIARGDLTAQMHGSFHGVFEQMRRDADTTIAQLRQIVGRIQTAAHSITVSAAEIATGNSDLSIRTEQQAANLEETAASMEELTATVRQNAEHARQANQLAIGAHSVASEGGSVVDQVITTMTAIEVSSKRIADIVSVIDGIAFQTNILALNAAVEAARAGEQGRGFAVVASEVRTLAQRSAASAKEIRGLINDSVEQVASGANLVQQAGATMGEIVSSVQRVTDIMAEISAASQEQSAGIEQVNHTITGMDETTQQNAALVEEASAAARSMEEQAEQLVDAVSAFTMKNAGAESAEGTQTALSAA
jgi:methyl-accepting chemotaxis protein